MNTKLFTGGLRVVTVTVAVMVALLFGANPASAEPSTKNANQIPSTIILDRATCTAAHQAGVPFYAETFDSGGPIALHIITTYKGGKKEEQVVSLHKGADVSLTIPVIEGKFFDMQVVFHDRDGKRDWVLATASGVIFCPPNVEAVIFPGMCDERNRPFAGLVVSGRLLDRPSSVGVYLDGVKRFDIGLVPGAYVRQVVRVPDFKRHVVTVMWGNKVITRLPTQSYCK